MSKLNIFEKLPEGYKRIENQDDYKQVCNTITRAFADACYPIPSMLMKHDEYMSLYGTFAPYWVEHSYRNGDIICSKDFSAVVLLSSMENLCDLPFEEIRQKIGDDVNPVALDNALAMLESAGHDEHNLQAKRSAIFVEIFAVHPDAWKKGNGSKIMRELFKECDKADRDLVLLTNSPRNSLIYKHLGYEILLQREAPELNATYFYMIRHSSK